MRPGVNRQWAISETAVTSAAAGDEALREAGQIVRHEPAFDHLDAPPPRQLYDGAPRDPVQKQRRSGVILPSLMKKMLRRCIRRRDPASPHHGVGIAFAFSPMLGDVQIM